MKNYEAKGLKPHSSILHKYFSLANSWKVINHKCSDCNPFYTKERADLLNNWQQLNLACKIVSLHGNR